MEKKIQRGVGGRQNNLICLGRLWPSLYEEYDNVAFTASCPATVEFVLSQPFHPPVFPSFGTELW